MAKSKKNKERERQKRAEKRNNRRKDHHAHPPAPLRPKATGELPAELEPPDLHRCLPPIYVDASGVRIDDPRKTLGLPVDRVPAEAEVREGWRAALVRNPPERDPEGARKIREARDRLLDPEHFMERELGVLHLPDPRQWNLKPPETPRLDTASRLGAEAVLYALVEDALWKEGLEALMGSPGRR